MLGDFIVYKQGLRHYCGKVTSIVDAETADPRLVIEQYSNELETIGSEDVIELDQVTCNLYNAPTLGSLYGLQLTRPARKVKEGDNLVRFYFPKEVQDPQSVDLTPYLQAIEEVFTILQDTKATLVDKTYDIKIEEGEAHKSTVKKAVDFDFALNLRINFNVPETIKDAIIFALSQIIWKTSSYDNRSDWLRVFSEDLVYEQINNNTFTERFFKYIADGQKAGLEVEDEIVCKALIKEIKRIKCLSLKELKILYSVAGESYIIKELLPEVINSVRLKNSVRIHPLVGMNAVKKFSSELVHYLITKRTDPNYEPVLKLFFD
jgi:hypothetical protein